MDKVKVLAFGASNSKASINKQLATFAANQIPNASVTILDLNDYDMPMYGIDHEREFGIPQAAKNFKSLIKEHDGIIISFAEHNGAYSAVFKNIFDWVSRLEGKVWENKPMMLMATSNGKRGGASVLEIAASRMPFSGGLVASVFSLPEFKINFSAEAGIINEELLEKFQQQIQPFSMMLDRSEVSV